MQFKAKQISVMLFISFPEIHQVTAQLSPQPPSTYYYRLLGHRCTAGN